MDRQNQRVGLVGLEYHVGRITLRVRRGCHRCRASRLGGQLGCGHPTGGRSGNQGASQHAQIGLESHVRPVGHIVAVLIRHRGRKRRGATHGEAGRIGLQIHLVRRAGLKDHSGRAKAGTGRGRDGGRTCGFRRGQNGRSYPTGGGLGGGVAAESTQTGNEDHLRSVNYGVSKLIVNCSSEVGCISTYLNTGGIGLQLHIPGDAYHVHLGNF